MKIKKNSDLNNKIKRKSKYEITIDYPRDEEIISYREHYAIRVGTPNNGIVQISIDGGEFVQCRYAAGYWWYDWCDIPLGQHTIVARLVDPNTKRVLKKSNQVRCVVK